MTAGKTKSDSQDKAAPKKAVVSVKKAPKKKEVIEDSMASHIKFDKFK